MYSWKSEKQQKILMILRFLIILRYRSEKLLPLWGKKIFQKNISNFLRANNEIFQVLRLGISGAEKANGFADNKRGKQPTQLIFNNLERALKLQRNFEVFNGVFSNGGFSEF